MKLANVESRECIDLIFNIIINIQSYKLVITPNQSEETFLTIKEFCHGYI